MTMRLTKFIFIVATACSIAVSASEPMAPIKAGASATKARDINGFALGMSIEEAEKRVTVTFSQGELVQSSLNGVQYDFGVCPSGQIYRIESRQQLGDFIVDKPFTDRLNAQLIEKYGTVATGSPDNLHWALIEPVRYSDGEVRLFKTNWFSVMVSGGVYSPVSLDMKMLDFRICWEGKEASNRQPRDEASDKIIF
jgi:hypothetical protein